MHCTEVDRMRMRNHTEISQPLNFPLLIILNKKYLLSGLVFKSFFMVISFPIIFYNIFFFYFFISTKISSYILPIELLKFPLLIFVPFSLYFCVYFTSEQLKFPLLRNPELKFPPHGGWYRVIYIYIYPWNPEIAILSIRKLLGNAMPSCGKLWTIGQILKAIFHFRCFHIENIHFSPFNLSIPIYFDWSLL